MEQTTYARTRAPTPHLSHPQKSRMILVRGEAHGTES